MTVRRVVPSARRACEVVNGCGRAASSRIASAGAVGSRTRLSDGCPILKSRPCFAAAASSFALSPSAARSKLRGVEWVFLELCLERGNARFGLAEAHLYRGVNDEAVALDTRGLTHDHR